MASQFLQALGYSSAPLLPLYLEHLEANRAQIGMIMSAAAIGGLLFRPVVGWALDTLGRKPTLVVGTVIVSAMMIGVIGVVDIGPYVYINRAIYGIGIGALFSGYFAFAADIVPDSRRTEGIALFGVAGLAPLAFNPMLGELGVAPEDMRWFFAAVGVAIALSLIFLLQVPEPKVDPNRKPVRLGDVVRALTHPTVLPVWLATIIFSGLVALYFTFASVAAENRGIESATAMWMTYAIGAIAIRLFGARLPDRIGTSNLVAPALGVYCVSYLLSAGGTTQVHFLVAGGLAGLGHGYCFPVLLSQVVTRMPERLRGVGTATFTALWDVSSITLAPAFGLVADARGDGVMFTLAVLCAVVGLALWAVLEQLLGRRDPQLEPA